MAEYPDLPKCFVLSCCSNDPACVCLHNIPHRGAIQTERLGLVIERVVPTFDQRIRNELNWDSPASAI